MSRQDHPKDIFAELIVMMEVDINQSHHLPATVALLIRIQLKSKQFVVKEFMHLILTTYSGY